MTRPSANFRTKIFVLDYGWRIGLPMRGTSAPIWNLTNVR